MIDIELSENNGSWVLPVFNLAVCQLPADYVTPAGMAFGSYWALYVNGKLTVAENLKSDIDELIKTIKAQA